jgi:hypothetical protein
MGLQRIFLRKNKRENAGQMQGKKWSFILNPTPAGKMPFNPTGPHRKQHELAF